MDHDRNFSCFLIGADTLLIECGEVLLQKGHSILGLITQTQRIIEWAQSKQIPTINASDNYENILREQSFDYLFSITHLEIISDKVLALPKKLAINFHDGPLPRYAGLNTPAWALMNREKNYGITWHIMEPGVDKGDILKQQNFEISANETSLSINTQCFAAALESFPVLIEELCAGTSQAHPQDLSVRSYFSKFQRPSSAGMLKWRRPAVELEAQIRALDFGDYPNTLASAKAIYKEQAFVITGAVASDTGQTSDPGTILSIEEGEIKIATGDGALNLTALRSLRGQTMSPGELAHNYGLVVGQSMSSLNDEKASLLDDANQQFARSEAYWVNQLATLEPIEIPYAETNTLNTSETRHYQSLDIELPASFLSLENHTDITLKSAGAFALLLARLGNKDSFDLAYTNDAIQRQAQGFEHIIANEVALHLAIKADTSCNSQLTQIADNLKH